VKSPFVIDSIQRQLYKDNSYFDIFVSKNLLQIEQRSCYNL